MQDFALCLASAQGLASGYGPLGDLLSGNGLRFQASIERRKYVDNGLEASSSRACMPLRERP